MSAPNVSIIVAFDNNRAIGKNGKLPWKLSKELQRFKHLTTDAPDGMHNVVIMGRKTFDSIPEKFKPLPDRYNVVLTHDPSTLPKGVLYAMSLEEALSQIHLFSLNTHRVFVIGGASVYKEALTHRCCDTIYITHIDCHILDADVFFPDFDESEWRVDIGESVQEKDLTYVYKTFTRII